MSRHGVIGGVLTLVGVSVVGVGCTYEKTVYWRPALSAAPGAISGGEEFSEKPQGYRDPTQLAEGKIRLESGGGQTVLVARTGRHLMAHIYQTLKDDERALFTEQVVCEQTKAEFRERDMQPGEAFDYLKEHERDVMLLFARMPQGEYSPGVMTRQLPGGVTRVMLNRKVADGLRWRGFDMVWEGGRMISESEQEAEQVTVPTLEEAVAEAGSVNGGLELIRQAKAKQPKVTFVQSGWKLRWFIAADD